jgi:hypothetical protein
MPQPKKPKVDAPGPDDVLASLGALRERLVSSLTLTSDRLQETVDDAVRRGRMTRKDAEELLGALVAAGRAQTESLLAEVEGLLGGRAKTRHGDAVRRTVDKARRAVGGAGAGAAAPAPAAFPIEDYDSLNASEIAKRLKDLTPAELRKVRDREKRGKARKSVLGAVERRLA